MPNIHYCGSICNWALVACVATAHSAPGDGTGQKSESLLRNGGFEQLDAAGKAPKEWGAADWSAADKRRSVTVAVDRAAPPEGDYAAKLVYDGKGGNVVMYQDVGRPGVGEYLLKFKCKPSEGTFAYASAVAFDGSKRLVYENTKRATDPENWHEQELRFIAPAATKYIRIILRGNGSAFFDDVSLVLLPPGSIDAGSVGDTRQKPSNARALQRKAKTSELMYDPEKDRARKAKMSPDELAWEKVLEQELGAFYLPRYKLAKERGRETAWDFVEDDPALPRVLLIGDSTAEGTRL